MTPEERKALAECIECVRFLMDEREQLLSRICELEESLAAVEQSSTWQLEAPRRPTLC